MAKEVRYFRQVISHLKNKYGKDNAREIISKARERYSELLEENGDEPKEYYMHPKLSWDRTKTIGHGDEVCDFRVHIIED